VNGAIAELALVRAAEDGVAHPGDEFWEEAMRLRDLLKFEFFFADKETFRDELRAEVALLAAPLVPEFALLNGHAVIEIKPALHTKGSAIEGFLAEPPFFGRKPAFIGDDITDYAGFSAVRSVGGMAIAVGPRVKSEWWLPGPNAVRRWLEQLAEHK
jgi:trehalose-phosphatase